MRRATMGKRSSATRAYGSSQPVKRASGVRPAAELSTSALAGRGEAGGRTLGPYELIELLGTGSSGYVYRARHAVLQRSVAIKVLSHELAEDWLNVARFVAEARAVNMLDHAHVLDVTDIHMASEPGEVPWFVMELLEGSDLRDMLAGKPMDLLESLRIMRDVCQGLDVTHRQGIVHRDVKPENIFVARIDGRDVVKLIDFGIARLRDALSAEPVIVGEIIGTPCYMAPEQTGMREVDHRADLYAVGAVLLEMLTGEPPFGTDDLTVLVDQLLHQEAPLASSRVTLPKAVRDDVDWLIARCLKKEPGDRYATARAVIADIDRIVDTLGAAEKIEKLARLPNLVAPPRSDRRRITYGVAGVAAVALAAVLVATWFSPSVAHEPSPNPAPPPPAPLAEAPSVLPSPPAEVPEATEAKRIDAAAKRPARRGPRRGARVPAPPRVAIPLVANPEHPEPTAAEPDSQVVWPTAPRAPQLLQLRPPAD